MTTQWARDPKMCREYQVGGWCTRPAEPRSDWCLDHIAERQVWQQKMRRSG